MLYVVKIRLNADFCFKMKNFELLKLKTLSKRWRKILFAEFLMSLSEFLRVELKPGLNAYLRATYTPDGGVFVVEAIGAPNRNGAIRNLGPHEGRNKTAKRYRDADRQPHK